MNARAALKSYGAVHVDAGVQGASSHRLIQMLFDGLLERIAQAKGAIQQKNIEMKGRKINDAVSILFGLKDSLDMEQGGDLAGNLYDLYDYIQRLLQQAHLKNDENLLDESGRLVSQVASGWREMGKTLG